MSVRNKDYENPFYNVAIFDTEVYEVSWENNKLFDHYILDQCTPLKRMTGKLMTRVSTKVDESFHSCDQKTISFMLTQSDIESIGHELQQLIFKVQSLEREKSRLSKILLKKSKALKDIPLGFGSGRYIYAETLQCPFREDLVQEVPRMRWIEGIRVQDENRFFSSARFILLPEREISVLQDALCLAFGKLDTDKEELKDKIGQLKKEKQTNIFEVKQHHDFGLHYQVRDEEDLDKRRMDTDETTITSAEETIKTSILRPDDDHEAAALVSAENSTAQLMRYEPIISEHSLRRRGVENNSEAKWSYVTSGHPIRSRAPSEIIQINSQEDEMREESTNMKVIEELRNLQDSVKCCAELKELLVKTDTGVAHLEQAISICQRQNAELKGKLDKQAKGSRTFKQTKRVLYGFNRRSEGLNGKWKKKETVETKSKSLNSRRTCYRCRQKGHVAKDCHDNQKSMIALKNPAHARQPRVCIELSEPRPQRIQNRSGTPIAIKLTTDEPSIEKSLHKNEDEEYGDFGNGSCDQKPASEAVENTLRPSAYRDHFEDELLIDSDGKMEYGKPEFMTREGSEFIDTAPLETPARNMPSRRFYHDDDNPMVNLHADEGATAECADATIECQFTMKDVEVDDKCHSHGAIRASNIGISLSPDEGKTSLASYMKLPSCARSSIGLDDDVGIVNNHFVPKHVEIAIEEPSRGHDTVEAGEDTLLTYFIATEDSHTPSEDYAYEEEPDIQMNDEIQGASSVEYFSD